MIIKEIQNPQKNSQKEHPLPQGYTQIESEFEEFFSNLPYIKAKISKGEQYKVKRNSFEVESGKSFYANLANFIQYHKTALDLIPQEKLNLK